MNTIRTQRQIALASLKVSLEAALAYVEILTALEDVEDAQDGSDAADGPTGASEGQSEDQGDKPSAGMWVDTMGGERTWIEEP